MAVAEPIPTANATTASAATARALFQDCQARERAGSMAETLPFGAEPSQQARVERITLTATGIRADPLAQCANSSRASPSASARRSSSSSSPGLAGSTRPSSRPTTGACGRRRTSGLPGTSRSSIPTSSSSKSTTRRFGSSRSRSSAAGRGRAWCTPCWWTSWPAGRPRWWSTTCSYERRRPPARRHRRHALDRRRER